jgi:hypothetical protein
LRVEGVFPPHFGPTSLLVLSPFFVSALESLFQRFVLDLVDLGDEFLRSSKFPSPVALELLERSIERRISVFLILPQMPCVLLTHVARVGVVIHARALVDCPRAFRGFHRVQHRCDAIGWLRRHCLIVVVVPSAATGLPSS